ncbi:MAG: threonine synthase, partial [Clostridiales bacterium]|nr:threonine synthase [Clostridiales bacterium]
MDLKYISTRGAKEKITASRAIVNGLAADEGLYVPETVPAAEQPLEALEKLPYKALAFEILQLWLTDFYEAEL